MKIKLDLVLVFLRKYYIRNIIIIKAGKGFKYEIQKTS